MTARLGALSLLTALFFVPALALKAPAQDFKSFSLGSFQSPKGIGASFEIQKEPNFFDSYDIITDMFGILKGDYSRPGFKATYCRGIILRQFIHDEYTADLYAGPGVTAGYVRDIHEPFSLVAGMTGAAGCRLYFDSRRLVVHIELGVDLAAEFNRNNRFKRIDLDIYKSGLLHFFYPQVRLLYRL